MDDFPSQASIRTGTKDMATTGTRATAIRATATAISKATAATVVMATMTTLLATMAMVVDMTTVSAQAVCFRLPDHHGSLIFAQRCSDPLSRLSDQGNTSYGKTPRRGGHQSSYKPY